MYNPYQNPMQEYGYGFQNQPVTAEKSLIKVNGIEGAKAYQMGANSVVALFHETDNVMYIKATDGANYPTITAYRYEPQVEEKHLTPEYVSKDDFINFREEVMASVDERIQQIKPKSAKSKSDE